MPMTRSVYGQVTDDNKLTIKIINLNTQDEVDIYYTRPESIDDAYSANFDEKSIVGRSTPLLVYSGGTSRDINFSLVFHEDYLGTETNILKFIGKLRAMSYPVYDGGIKVPKVYVRVGRMYSFWGVMNTTVKYSGPVRDGHMIMATVDFSFKKISNVSPNNYKDSGSTPEVPSAYTVADEYKLGGF